MIIQGDSLEEMKKMADNSVDSIVTDPPYGIRMMNKHWDYELPSVEVWREALRVLKPGGHILVACGTRTQHRMAVNIEDAGFEIRDIITYHYGSGFPKSLNINKDERVCQCKELAEKQKTEHDLQRMSETGISETVCNGKTEGGFLLSRVQEQETHIEGHTGASQSFEDGEKSGMEGRCDNVQKEGELQEYKIHQSSSMGTANGAEGRIYNGTQTNNGNDVQPVINASGSSTSQRPRSNEQQAGESRTIPNERNTQVNGVWKTCDQCGKPILPQGLGSAMKPATELFTLARKPLECNTIAENVLKYGTGGINIDGCRVMPTQEQINYDVKRNGHKAGMDHVMKIKSQNSVYNIKSIDHSTHEHLKIGRFPANLIFSCECNEQPSGMLNGSQHTEGCPVGELDRQSGVKTSGTPGIRKKEWAGYSGGLKHLEKETGFGDTGTASRFFYCAKPSQSERNAGLEKHEKKIVQGRDVNQDARAVAYKIWNNARQNTHPTVKPIKLMQYLTRLITPPGGTVLDPYNGSGTTGCACVLEGFEYIGIEREPDYVQISIDRIAHYKKTKPNLLFQ